MRIMFFFNWIIDGIQITIIFNQFISTCTLGSTLKNSCWKGANKNSFSFVQMRDDVVYVNPCFLTLVK
jgi:hypothetical protein